MGSDSISPLSLPNLYLFYCKTSLTHPVIITGRPNAVLPLRFRLFYVRCCSIFKCFNFNTSV